MKKLSTCVLSAGLVMLIGIGGVNAASERNAIAKRLFGGDITSFAADTKAISAGLSEAKKSVAKASSKLEELSMNTKTFNPYVEVASPLVIAYNLDQGASVLEKISRALSILNEGLTTMNKSKSSGDSYETNARNRIQHAMMALEAAEGLLPSVRANISILGKFIANKDRPVSNAGEVEKTLQGLIDKLSNDKQNKILLIIKTIKEKKCLISLMNEYQENYRNIIDNINDRAIKEWFTNGEKRIAAVRETLKLFEDLLKAIVVYLNEQSTEQLVTLGQDCESQLQGYQKQEISGKKGKGNKKRNSLERSNTVSERTPLRNYNDNWDNVSTKKNSRRSKSLSNKRRQNYYEDEE